MSKISFFSVRIHSITTSAFVFFLALIGLNSFSLATESASASKDPETLVFSFQKQKNPEELEKTANAVAAFLSQKIGKKVEVLVPTSYGATSQGLISNKVHVAYMDSLPYLLAKNEVDLEILAVEKRNGRTEYESLVVVGKDSPLKSLSDLKGKKMAFSSQTSTSGFLFPVSNLVQSKLIKSSGEVDKYFEQVVYAGGYDKALLAVANGQTDAAAFSDYAFEGAKANLYGTDELRAKVKVLARLKGVPTHLIAASAKLSSDLRKKIQAALLDLGKSNPELLTSVYGAAELVKPAAGDAHVLSTKTALKDVGLEPKYFVK